MTELWIYADNKYEKMPEKMYVYDLARSLLALYNLTRSHPDGHVPLDEAVSVLHRWVGWSRMRVKQILRGGHENGAWRLGPFKVNVTGYVAWYGKFGAIPSAEVWFEIPLEDVRGHVANFKRKIREARLMKQKQANQSGVAMYHKDAARIVGSKWKLHDLRRKGYVQAVQTARKVGEVSRSGRLVNPNAELKKKPGEGYVRMPNGDVIKTRQTANVWLPRGVDENVVRKGRGTVSVNGKEFLLYNPRHDPSLLDVKAAARLRRKQTRFNMVGEDAATNPAFLDFCRRNYA